MNAASAGLRGLLTQAIARVRWNVDSKAVETKSESLLSRVKNKTTKLAANSSNSVTRTVFREPCASVGTDSTKKDKELSLVCLWPQL